MIVRMIVRDQCFGTLYDSPHNAGHVAISARSRADRNVPSIMRTIMQRAETLVALAERFTCS
jgi:hypothetical protein